MHYLNDIELLNMQDERKHVAGSKPRHMFAHGQEHKVPRYPA